MCYFKYHKNRVLIILSLIAVLVVTFISFYPSLNNDFVNWDDPEFLTQNKLIKELSPASISKMFTTFKLLDFHRYYPLTLLSFAVEHHFFKLNPKIYHTDNLILHLLNSLLVFLLIFLLSKNTIVSFLTALLFGIHPMHVESVAWVTERKDVLYAFFYLGALNCYCLYCLKDKFKIRFLAGAFILFILSLLSKPMAITLPVVFFVFDYYFGRRLNRNLFIEKAPFFLLSLIFGLFTLTQNFEGTLIVEERFNFFQLLLISVYSLNFYLWKLFAPFDLVCLVPFPYKLSSFMYVKLFSSAGFFLLCAFFVFQTRKFTKKIFFGFSFFILTISIVLNLKPVSDILVADRYSYVSYIGLFFILASGYHYLSTQVTHNKKILKIFLNLGVVGIFISLSILTYRQCQVWKDSRTLWSHVIKINPNIPLAYYNRGSVYLDEGDLDHAIADYSQSVTLDPNYMDAIFNRAITYHQKNELDLALSDVNRALQIDPDFPKSYLLRSYIYKDKRYYKEALRDAQKAYTMGYYYLEDYISNLNDLVKIESSLSDEDLFSRPAYPSLLRRKR